MPKRHFILFALAALCLSGCAARQEITQFEGGVPNTICIAHHTAVRDGFLIALQDSLKSHGVNSNVINANYVKAHGAYNIEISADDKKDCPAVMFYTAHWNWDLALYMSYANIWVTDAEQNNTLAQASYLTRNGLDKFIDAREKVFELVDNMVAKPKS